MYERIIINKNLVNGMCQKRVKKQIKTKPKTTTIKKKTNKKTKPKTTIIKKIKIKQKRKTQKSESPKGLGKDRKYEVC